MRILVRPVVSLLIVVLGVWLAARAGAQPPAPAAQTAQPSQADRNSGYEVLAKGVVASRVVPIQFKSTPLRMEFRNYLMGKGITDKFSVPTQVLMEVRLGQVNASVNDQRHEYHQGDFWVVESGSSVVLENPGEAAIVRAMYIYAGKAAKP